MTDSVVPGTDKCKVVAATFFHIHSKTEVLDSVVTHPCAPLLQHSESLKASQHPVPLENCG